MNGRHEAGNVNGELLKDGRSGKDSMKLEHQVAPSKDEGMSGLRTSDETTLIAAVILAVMLPS